MKIEFTQDHEYIRRHILQPHVWRASTDDALAGLNPGLFFIPYDLFRWIKVDGYGIFMLERIDDDTCRAHVALNKDAIGSAVKVSQAAMQWFFDNTSYKTLEALIPSNNRLAVRLARKSGMQFIKTLAKSYKKDGVLNDQHLFKLNKEALCQQ